MVRLPGATVLSPGRQTLARSRKEDSDQTSYQKHGDVGRYVQAMLIGQNQGKASYVLRQCSFSKGRSNGRQNGGCEMCLSVLPRLTCYSWPQRQAPARGSSADVCAAARRAGTQPRRAAPGLCSPHHRETSGATLGDSDVSPPCFGQGKRPLRY